MAYVTCLSVCSGAAVDCAEAYLVSLYWFRSILHLAPGAAQILPDSHNEIPRQS